MREPKWYKKISAWYRWTFYYRVTRNKEQLLLWFVGHLPREVAYRAAIRVGADATTGAYSNQNVPELTFMDALERWTKRDGGDRTNRKTRDDTAHLAYSAPVKVYDHAHDLAEAIRLTVEYVGNDMLPAIEGYSWFDALKRYNPDMVRPFVENPIHLHLGTKPNPWTSPKTLDE
jgi:hypothetical protein